MQDLLIIKPDGTVSCLWTEAVPLHSLGNLTIQRASTIEFNCEQQAWEVRLASNPERVAFSHPSREVCLQWEHETINEQLTNQNQ